MKNRLKAWLPAPETIRNNRWLRWLGPLLGQPKLWHFNRRGIAMGLALGIFFGLLIPIAQIPFAASAAVLLRANVPMAVASTLVTNPVTFGPVYYGAYRLGKALLGEPALTEQEAARELEQAQADAARQAGGDSGVNKWWHQLGAVGKPLILGLAILATAGGLLVYFLVSLAWGIKTRWIRRSRAKRRPHQGRSPM